MSGATIGGVIGAVVFTVFGGSPQVGWMVGSAIGGYIDPTQIYGPRLTDMRGQTSAVGGSIPRAWGTAPVPGNVIWQQPGVTEHKHTDDGKGSGTEQVTYTYTRSYAIMFHIGEITGVLQIKRNGKIVYDTRDDDTLAAEWVASGNPFVDRFRYLQWKRAENAKFISKCTIYTGTQTQNPDPTIEAYEGVGNVPSYRGRAYFVVTDDETQAGEIAQYEIVVNGSGVIVTNEVTSSIYWSTTDRTSTADVDMVLTGGGQIATSTDLTVSGGMAGVRGVTSHSTGRRVVEFKILANDSVANDSYYGLCQTGYTLTDTGKPGTVGHNGTTNYNVDGINTVDGAHDTDTGSILTVYIDFDTSTVWMQFDGDWLGGIDPSNPAGILGPIPSGALAPYFRSSASPSASSDEICELRITYAQMEHYTTGSWVAFEEWGADVQPIPDAPGWYRDADGTLVSFESTTSLTTVPVTIGEIVADVCELDGLTSAEYDVSQLTDLIEGFVIARETDAASVIDTLRPIGMFDPAEWDGKVRFIKRSGTAVDAINGDDLVERDGDAFERELVHEYELLRRVTVGYIDSESAWAPNTQKWERRVGTIDARGEATVEVSAVMPPDSAATIAKRKGLTAWGEPEKQKFSLPYRLAALTPTDVVPYTDADGEVHYLRLMQIEDDSGIRYIESANNCAEAYNATATGVVPKPPTITESSLIGPTNLVVMDLPLWRTSDTDDLGLYIAASGYYGGWTGAQVDVSTDSGTTYTTVAQVTNSATIGYTTTALTPWVSPENPEDQEVTVYLPDAPSSVSYETLLRYANRAAIQLDSGSWEILQYQTVTALGNDLYTLSGLVRGRYNTTPGTISSAATFVLLDNNVQFVRAERDTLGQTITVRATSYGTSSDAAVPFDFAFADGASQTEWPVHNVEASRDVSDNVTVTWIGRGRLGTETSPYDSTHFTGYRVTFDDGVTATSYDTTASTYTLSSAADPIDVTVAPINDITGAGQASDPITV